MDSNISSFNIHKRTLQCTMFMSRVYGEQEIKFSYLVYSVENYNNLETGVPHKRKFETVLGAADKNSNWQLNLKKMEDHIFLIIYCDPKIKNMDCYVSSNSQINTHFTAKKEHEQGKFSLKIPSEVVKHPETMSDPDTLDLYFRYGMEQSYWKTPLPIRGVHKEEEATYAREMLDLYETGRYSDFTIEARGKMFKVHKIILASRSKFFKNYFQKTNVKPTVKYDVSPECMGSVLQYFYSGQLNFQILSKDCICEIFYAACALEMELLQLRCVFHLRVLYKEKVSEIRFFAKIKGINNLPKKAEEFLEYMR